MKPYLSIDEGEWKYIKETFDKQDVKESLAKVAMTYEIPYALISENDAYKALMKLKGMRHNEIWLMVLGLPEKVQNINMI